MSRSEPMEAGTSWCLEDAQKSLPLGGTLGAEQAGLGDEQGGV